MAPDEELVLSKTPSKDRFRFWKLCFIIYDACLHKYMRVLQNGNKVDVANKLLN